MEYVYTADQLREFANQIEATVAAANVGALERVDLRDKDNNNMLIGYLSFDGDGIWGFIPELCDDQELVSVFEV